MYPESVGLRFGRLPMMHSTFENLLADKAFREGQYWERKTFSANETIILAGECGHEIFVILQGIVRVTGDIELDEGRSIHPGICDLEESAVFGELGLFSELPRTATVTGFTISVNLRTAMGARIAATAIRT